MKDTPTPFTDRAYLATHPSTGDGWEVARKMERALRALVHRCEGADGVKSDGSNICTLDAHAALGDFEEVAS